MTMKLSRRRLLLNAAAAALPTGAGLLSPLHALAQGASHDAPVSLEVNARKIEHFDPRDATHVRYGALEFRSGLVLTSSFRGFGGLSALRLDKKGEHFIALSDKANWFTGRFTYRGKALTGLADVKSAPILGGDGKKITTRGWFDTESLAFDGTTAYVGLERVNQILRFDFSKGGIRARGEPVPVPAGIDKLPFNKGLEVAGVRAEGTAARGSVDCDL